MKTPKRHVELTTMIHDGMEMVWDNSQWNVSTQRWKRKNRTAQLKRTIARLTDELAAAREACDYLCTAYMKCERRARQLYEYIMSERKNTHKPAESGQQTELPTAGGQQDCIAQNAENAKQETLICTGAEQLETRKGN